MFPPVSFPTPSHPSFPSTWTAEVAAAAKAHAVEAYPHEAVGIVEEGVYVRFENIAASPEEHVQVSPEDEMRAAGAQIVFHSHPDGLGCPSAHDMAAQEVSGVPFVIQPVHRGVALPAFPFGSNLPPEPLTGRSFRHGVFDCYTVIRDWYRADRDVDLPVIPRDWEWWLKGQNLYDTGWAAAGFRDIPVSELAGGDCVLFMIRARVPNHAGLVLPEGLLLHHVAGPIPIDQTRLSSVEPISRWLRFAVRGLRHASSE
jgi:proteasome lid subunit RPN8/RPN11